MPRPALPVGDDVSAMSVLTQLVDHGRQQRHDPFPVPFAVDQRRRDCVVEPAVLAAEPGDLDTPEASERGEHDGLVWLRLTSTSKDPQFAWVDLGFDDQGLARMAFRDQLGSATEIRFSDWQRNPSLPVGTFTFVPPKGADVIGDVPDISIQPIKD